MRRYGSIVLVLFMTVLLVSCSSPPLVPEVNYGRTVLDQVRQARTALAELRELASNPQLDDPVWREEIDVQMAALRNLIAEARALTPPAALAGAHQTYLDALDQLEQALTAVEEAVTASDAVRVEDATRLMAEAEQLLTRVRELVGNE